MLAVEIAVTCVFGLFVAMPALYLAFLAAATLHRAPVSPAATVDSGQLRFAVLIPAHDEESLIGTTVASLMAVAYPDDRFSVHVVADNCTDATADLARAAGACVHVRTDPARRGKGAALNWLIDRLSAEGPPADAIVVVDADSQVSSNLLLAMERCLVAGADAAQPLCLVTPSGGQPLVLIRELAYHLFCHLRPLAYSVLGASSGLYNGVCLSASLVKRYRWSESAVTEDGELFLRFIRDGRRVAMVGDATVHSAMPSTLRDTRSQALRHERGRFDHFRSGVWLIGHALSRRDRGSLFAGLSTLVPPFSLHALMAVLGLAVGAVLGWGAMLFLALSSAVCLTAYLLRGAVLGGLKPRDVIRILLWAPGYAVWRVWIVLLVALGVGRGSWSRTERPIAPKAGLE
jgi:cellulose synthase/poly-beta-1,6-N-acetylglucosamine synthase-like glycosyltransferase